MKGRELVRNGGFDGWADGLPSYWIATHPDTVAMDRAPGNDTRCLQITSLKDEWASVWQSLKVDARARGQEVEVSARIRGAHANMVRLAVQYKAGGKLHAEQAFYNSADQEWQAVKVRVRLPANYDPNTLVVNLGVRPSGKTACHVDDVSAKIL